MKSTRPPAVPPPALGAGPQDDVLTRTDAGARGSVLAGNGGAVRPCVSGKFLYVDGRKFYVRGVTFGTFRPEPGGSEYHDRESVEADFAQMAAHGINAIRTYTVPPRWLLDCAWRRGLRVMVGLPWEQHVAFLHDRRLARDIQRRVREGVRLCAGHPAVLCYAIGNEVPSSIVRWHGHRRVERHIESLYQTAKAEDPGGLVAYVNYPSTEYLDLPFVDLVCFNVYLETPDRLAAYLARLQNLAGDRPLLLAELGLDSQRHGLATQAETLDWQVRAAFAAGVAGLFVFAWTDEWHRGGYDVEDWDFGLTDRHRTAKPSLAAVEAALAAAPFPRDRHWPRVSVVVCTYNGARWLPDCLDGLSRLEYPDFEVIVVADGSRDATATIARRPGVRLIEIANSGLSVARNVGWQAATGEIVAYVDDDVRVDPHWLHYLAHAFSASDAAAIGGPNIAPPDDGAVAACVANAPGGPVHVLLADQIAEHIPGCNMAFRRPVLAELGGFDPQFRVAGDDVDICWRVQEAGYRIGFHAGAMVWHHRRNSIRAYWRQQVGYGRAEALLERKWPEKYNAAGQPGWRGRIYGTGRSLVLSWRRVRIYQGPWGTAPFQSIYEPAPSHFWSLARMPEWYLVIFGLAAMILLGLFWWPLHVALPLLILAAGPPLLQSALCATRVRFPGHPGPLQECALRLLTGLLHLAQPLARLVGRQGHGLTPWRRRPSPGLAVPGWRKLSIWSEGWRGPQEWAQTIETGLKVVGVAVFRGGDFDDWDFEARGGMLAAVRARIGIEEHGGGRQLVHVQLWPRLSPTWFMVGQFCAVIAVIAGHDYAPLASAAFWALAAAYWLVALQECARATAGLLRVTRALKQACEGRGRPAAVPPAGAASPPPGPERPAVPTTIGLPGGAVRAGSPGGLTSARSEVVVVSGPRGSIP